jgi:hypothetical protein
VVSVE